MKVLAISDVHRSAHMVRRALDFASNNGLELIACSGDFQSVEAIRLLSSFRGRVLAVPGNMDTGEELEALEEAGISLHGRSYEHGGYLFVGAGALNMGWALKSIEGAASTSPKLVLVTHYPPKGCRVDVALTGAHAGSSAVREFIESLRPIACLCGHIHEARGVDWIGETLIVNPGPLARGYAAIVDLDKREAELVEVASLGG